MKICCNCQLEKSLDNFSKNKNKKDGRHTQCKDCRKQYYNNNRKKALDYSKAWSNRNKERIKLKRKQYREKNKEHLKIKLQEWRSNNKDRMKEIRKAYYYKHPDKSAKYRKDGYIKRRDKIIEYKRKYHKKKRSEDILFKLKDNLRSRLNRAIKQNSKSGSAVNDLGCSIVEFKLYMESKFQSGMTWDNWGRKGWHIDHIKPLSSFDLTDRNELLKACHYTNLQPLWSEDNLKKSNKHGQ